MSAIEIVYCLPKIDYVLLHVGEYMGDRALFQDEVVRATELNRSSGEVLNKAARQPITIIRNDEAFALLKREIAAGWVREAKSATQMTELIWHVFSKPVTLEPEYQWLSAFDEEQSLEMMNELMEAYRKASRETQWDEFDAVLHEWSESGWTGSQCGA